MKKYILLLITFLLVGCVQISSKEPLIGTQPTIENVSIINVYPSEISLFRMGFTRFQNRLVSKKVTDFDIQTLIGNKIRHTFNKLDNINIKQFNISTEEEQYLTRQNESTYDYEKRIINIPNVINKAREQNIDKLILVTPSHINIPDTSIFLPNTGLLYLNTLGYIGAYSSTKIYFIDTHTHEITGSHEVHQSREPVILKNDLSNEQIEKIIQKHEDDIKYSDKNERGLPLEAKISAACTKLERFDSLSQQNIEIIKNTIKKTIDISFSKLENIYLNTPILKGSRPKSSSERYSCQE